MLKSVCVHGCAGADLGFVRRGGSECCWVHAPSQPRWPPHENLSLDLRKSGMSREHASSAQCALVVPQVKKSQSVMEAEKGTPKLFHGTFSLRRSHLRCFAKLAPISRQHGAISLRRSHLRCFAELAPISRRTRHFLTSPK